MTSNYIAKVVESMYQKINIDELMSDIQGIKMRDENYNLTPEFQRCQFELSRGLSKNNDFNRWIKACYTLEYYLQKNFETFEQTELVYKWAKDTCDRQIRYKNHKRAYLYFGTNF